MTKKRFVVISAIVLICLVLGIGLTLVAQKYGLSQQVVKAIKNFNHKENGPLVSIGEFMVNLQGNSFLKTSITIEGIDSKSEELLKEKDPFLKDAVITVLSEKSLAEVQTPQAREKIRQELLKRLNEISGNQVKKVLFVSFIYQ